jgi:hypothetical protein
VISSSLVEPKPEPGVAKFVGVQKFIQAASMAPAERPAANAKKS